MKQLAIFGQLFGTGLAGIGAEGEAGDAVNIQHLVDQFEQLLAHRGAVGGLRREAEDLVAVFLHEGGGSAVLRQHGVGQQHGKRGGGAGESQKMAACQHDTLRELVGAPCCAPIAARRRSAARAVIA